MRRVMTAVTISLVTCLGACLPTVVAHAQEVRGTAESTDLPDAVDRVLVLDVTTHPGKGEAVNRAFCFPGTFKMGDKKSETLWSYLRSATSNAEKLKTVVGHAKASSNRWASQRGDTLGVIVFSDPGTRGNIDVEELERNTRLSSDLVTLAKFVVKGGFGVRGKPDQVMSSYVWHLQRVRSNLTVAATAAALPKTIGESAAAVAVANEATRSMAARAAGDPDATRAVDTTATNAAAKAAEAEAGNKTETSLVTGPREHFFLSVNLPVNTITEFPLDDSGVAAPKEKPAKFLIGLNYVIGDLLSQGGYGYGVFGGFTFGGFCEASSKPGNSLGASIGYRFASRKAYGFELDTFSPFVGWMRTVSQSQNADGSTATRSVYKFAAGVSFNIDKALGWADGGSKK